MAARARSFEVQPAIRLEMARLQKCGLSLIPLGGPDGKSPLVMPKTADRLALRQILGPMCSHGSMTYGIRLSGMVVLDADNPSYLDRIESRFGPAGVVVATPRGCHAYYRADSDFKISLRREGWPVDVKQGRNAYVVGPISVRPDGGRYVAQRGILGSDGLPTITSYDVAHGRAADVVEGHRHEFLLREALGMVRCVNDEAELLGNLEYIRDQWSDAGSPVTDAEVAGIASWAWGKRLAGQLYSGRDSAFRVHRLALDRLKGNSDALALWVVLQDQHGHMGARSFALNHAAMRKAGHTDLTRRRFRAAIEYLVTVGLLEIAANHCTGWRSRQFRLRRAFDCHGDKVRDMRVI